MNGSRVQWKSLGLYTDPWNIEVMGESKSSQLKLPNGFKTSATFELLDIESNVKYVTFIDQKPDSDNPELFTRTYVTKFIRTETTDMFPTLDKDFYNNTVRGMRDKIIGTMGQFKIDSLSFGHYIFYSRNNVIEYCGRLWSRSKGNDSQSKIEMIANALKETVS